MDVDMIERKREFNRRCRVFCEAHNIPELLFFQRRLENAPEELQKFWDMSREEFDVESILSQAQVNQIKENCLNDIKTFNERAKILSDCLGMGDVYGCFRSFLSADRKKIDNVLNENDAHYKSLLDNSIANQCTTDKGALKEQQEQAALDILGVPQEEKATLKKDVLKKMY